MNKVESHHLGLFGINLDLLYKRKEFSEKFAAELLNCSIDMLIEYEKNGLRYYQFGDMKVYKREWLIDFIYNYKK